MEQEPVPKIKTRPNFAENLIVNYIQTRPNKTIEHQYSMSLMVSCAKKCRGLVTVNFFCGALI